MNNLTFGTAVLASAATLCFIQHARQLNMRSSSAELTGQLRTAEEQLASTRTNLYDLQKRLAARQIRLHGAEADLAAAETEAMQAVPPDPDPAKEGAWPAAQPYFYVAKRRLKDIGYLPILPNDQVAPTAAALFAMSPQERAAVEAAARDFRQGLNSLELEHAQKLDPAPGVNTDDHREVSFRVPAVTNGVEQLAQSFNAAVTSALGAERGGLFLDHANDWLDREAREFSDSTGEFSSEAWTITYRADRKPDGSVDHWIQLKNPHATRSLPVHFPLEPSSGLWRYAHLFGDQPLLTPTPDGLQQP